MSEERRGVKNMEFLRSGSPHVIWKCLLVYEPALQPGEWGDGSRKCCLSRSWLPGIARKDLQQPHGTN